MENLKLLKSLIDKIPAIVNNQRGLFIGMAFITAIFSFSTTITFIVAGEPVAAIVFSSVGFALLITEVIMMFVLTKTNPTNFDGPKDLDSLKHVSSEKIKTYISVREIKPASENEIEGILSFKGSLSLHAACLQKMVLTEITIRNFYFENPEKCSKYDDTDLAIIPEIKKLVKVILIHEPVRKRFGMITWLKEVRTGNLSNSRFLIHKFYEGHHFNSPGNYPVCIGSTNKRGDECASWWRSYARPTLICSNLAADTDGDGVPDYPDVLPENKNHKPGSLRDLSIDMTAFGEMSEN